MKRRLGLVCLVIALALSMTGCMETEEVKEKRVTKEVTSKLTSNQPTPTDIDFSLERYNLIKRAYWVNGMVEKAKQVECPVTKPLGYIVLIDYGNVVQSYCVDGKVSSLNSYLSPDSERYATSSYADWLADVDGSYGENDGGIFFFDIEGEYHEWNGTYLYSSKPFHLNAEPLVSPED